MTNGNKDTGIDNSVKASCISKNKEIDRNQYMEIYKIHAGTINNASDRRINVSRYYILALSVLILALSAILRGGDFLGLSDGSDHENGIDKQLIGVIMLVIGALGIFLSISWFANMRGYLHSNSNRYMIIKNLEYKLPYQFIQSVWGKVYKEPLYRKYDDGNNTYIPYFKLSFHELFAPCIFFIGFLLLATFGIYQMFPEEGVYNIIGMFIAFIVNVSLFSVVVSVLITQNRSIQNQ